MRVGFRHTANPVIAGLAGGMLERGLALFYRLCGYYIIFLADVKPLF